MPNDAIHPVSSVNAYAANDLIQLKRLGLAYFQQLTKVFGDLSHQSVQAPADYAMAATSYGISAAQAEALWNYMNGAIAAWNGTGQNANNKNLVDLVAG